MHQNVRASLLPARRKKRVEKKEEKMFNEFTGNGRVVVSGRYASASTQLAMEFVEVRVRMQVRISTVSGDGCSDIVRVIL